MLEKIALRCYAVMGIAMDDIKKRSRGTALSEAKSLIAYRSSPDLGLKVSEIKALKLLSE